MKCHRARRTPRRVNNDLALNISFVNRLVNAASCRDSQSRTTEDQITCVFETCVFVFRRNSYNHFDQ